MLMGMSFLLSRELLLNLVKNVPVYNYVITSDIFCIMFQSLLHLAIHLFFFEFYRRKVVSLAHFLLLFLNFRHGFY